MKTAIHAATTAAGIILAIWAVYQGVRLDWAETAMVAGVTCFTVGSVLLWQQIESLTRD